MSYSRRQLEAFGEPLGESVTRKESGRIVYGSGGGGGGSGTQTTVTEVPDWAKGTAQKSLAGAEALTFQKDAQGNVTGFQPYQQYGGERTAQFTPLQQQAFTGAGNMQTSPQLGTATDLMGTAAQRAMDIGYTPGQFGFQQAQAPNLQNFQMGPAERVSTQSFRQPGAAEAYMDPYMQNVVNIQQREAQRAADIAGTQRGAQAVGAGAFGGSRQAIMDAEAARNLSQQKGDIQARGLQSAFQNAQQQFNAEQGYGLQAQQANQGAGLTVGQQNLAAKLGVQQLGAGQNLQAQLANQQQAMEAQRLGEQSRQFGGSLGMQGLQAAMTGAGQLGALGQQEFGQQKDILGMQNQFGSQQQQQVQNILSQQYQDFLNQKKHPYQQLEFLSNMIRGTPMGTVQTMYGAQPTMAQNIGALGMGAYGLNQMMGRAEGGTVSSYADGGSVDSPQSIEAIVDKLSDPQLKQAAEAAQARGDVEQLQIIQQEMAMRASERGGMAGAFNQLPQEQQQQMMAGGGMVAFRGDENENDEDTGQQVTDRIPVGRGDPVIYGQSMAGLRALQTKMSGDTGYSPLTPAEEKAMYDRSTARGKEIYGNLLDKIKTDITTQRGESAESLRQGRGLAALQAAAAMTQGRGLAQGLGRAGGAFAGAYGQALRSDKEQKRALSAMELNLAKAESDQLMGLHDKAEAQITKANANREKAHTAGVNRDKAMADILYKSGRLALPPAPTKTGGGPKLSPDERIADKFEAIASGKVKYMGKTGPEAADAYIEGIGKSGAARTGVRYTGPDKTFDRQLNLQKLYANDPQLKSLADSLALARLGNNQKRIDTLTTAISDRETALKATLPEVPTAEKSTPTPKPAAQSTAPTLEQFMTAARAAPANKDISDADLRAYYQSTYGRK
jgi:hypothetical protein